MIAILIPVTYQVRKIRKKDMESRKVLTSYNELELLMDVGMT